MREKPLFWPRSSMRVTTPSKVISLPANWRRSPTATEKELDCRTPSMLISLVRPSRRCVMVRPEASATLSSSSKERVMV